MTSVTYTRQKLPVRFQGFSPAAQRRVCTDSKLQSSLLFMTCLLLTSPEKSPPQLWTSLCWLLCKQTNVAPGAVPGHSVRMGEGMVTVRLTGSKWEQSATNNPRGTGASKAAGPRGQALSKQKEKGHLQVLCPVL